MSPIKEQGEDKSKFLGRETITTKDNLSGTGR